MHKQKKACNTCYVQPEPVVFGFWWQPPKNYTIHRASQGSRSALQRGCSIRSPASFAPYSFHLRAGCPVLCRTCRMLSSMTALQAQSLRSQPMAVKTTFRSWTLQSTAGSVLQSCCGDTTRKTSFVMLACQSFTEVPSQILYQVRTISCIQQFLCDVTTCNEADNWASCRCSVQLPHLLAEWKGSPHQTKDGACR